MEFSTVTLFFVAAFGAILGSFINALSFRFNTGRSMWGRSRCMNCRHHLNAIDLVPLVSFLLLLGKCRYCGTKISIQYPLVEFIAATLTLLVYLNHPDPSYFIFWIVVWMTLLFIAVYDIRHTIIPWSCSITLLGLSFFYILLNSSSPMDLFAGPLLALPLFLISLLSWGRWMGWSDGILELSLGWFLGLSVGLSALILAFWSGAIVGSVLLFNKSRDTMNSEIPFAPFLIFGAAVAHFFHVDFLSSIAF